MDAFNGDFQEFIFEKMSLACSQVKDEKEWKEVNDKYDKLHDVLKNSMNRKEQEVFEEFVQSIWKKVSIEMCISYMMGLADKKTLQKYESTGE